MLPIRSQEDSDMQRERSYRTHNPDEYSEKGQRELERLQECQRAFEVKPVTYQDDLTRVWYAQGFFKGRLDDGWTHAATAGAASLVERAADQRPFPDIRMAGDPQQ